MTDKEFEQWEKEYKDTSMDIKTLLKFAVLIILLGAMFAIILSV
tara:strand:+ start:1351 stop:1482 length:132 start_codon:yes stop_codon:yes gene_type:complete